MIIHSNIKHRIPLANLDVNLLVDGDSITQGINNSGIDQYYPKLLRDRLIQLCESVTLNSFGVSGQTTLQMMSDYESQILSLINPSKHNIFIAYEDVNAILNNGRTAQQNYNDFEIMYDRAKDLGVQTCIHINGAYPRVPYNQAGWSVGEETPLDRQHDYFELCRTRMKSVDVRVDLRESPTIGGERGQNVNPLKNKDSVHFESQGYQDLEFHVFKYGIMKIFK